ncbi:COX15/CtaA family protein [Phragmitibacter flavus]|nr:COX15/CtaA family protein [Phragmitibacter flavus]
MKWTLFQKIALVTFITVELLIFVGASVRASGSGLGCPDWPLCYGRLIPPTKVEDIDFDHLDLEKFREKAARHGRDPASITEESLRAEFDAVSTWIEYFNRLTSMPVGLSVLVLFVASFGQFKLRRPGVFAAAVASLFLVLLNAWLGAQVVLSGLKPGIITLHMALAILLQCMLVYTAWGGTSAPWRLKVEASAAPGLFWVASTLLGLVVLEGILGSQVREMTDELSRIHQGESRSDWVGELEQSMSYIYHRSFSWVIVGWTLYFAWRVRRSMGGFGWLELSIVGLVFAQMVLGIVLAHVGIVRTAQVLHIGLSSLLVSGLFLWILGVWRARSASARG